MTNNNDPTEVKKKVITPQDKTHSHAENTADELKKERENQGKGSRGRPKEKADEKDIKEKMPWSEMFFEEVKCYECGGNLNPDLSQCSVCGKEINYGFGAIPFEIIFDKSAIATGFGINEEDIPKLARRNVSSIAKFVEYYACRHFGSEQGVKYKVSEDQQANPDIVADVSDNEKFPSFEVRCFRTVKNPGVKSDPKTYFTQSKHKNYKGLLYKLNKVNGYFLLDATLFPDCKAYYIPTPTVVVWLFLEDDKYRLSKTGVIKTEDLIELLENTIEKGIVKVKNKNVFKFSA